MSALEEFNRSQMERFQRHFSLDGFGIEAQAKLLRARVAVIGAGALGSPVLTYLAAAGVGTIDLIDDDVVERSNLHRQVIHSEQVLGEPKAASAAETMRGLHPEVQVHEHRVRINAQNALELLGQADIVVDGSDNFATRYVVSDACEILGTPLVSGSILRFYGQVGFFWSRLPDGTRGPTYRDLYPEEPAADEVPTCAEAGVLGVLPGVIGTLMATETIKHITGIGQSLLGRVMTYDALSANFQTLNLQPDPQRTPVTEMSDGEPVADAACAVPAPSSGGTEENHSPTAQQPSPTEAAPAAQPEPAPEPDDLDFNPFTGEAKQPDDLSPAEFRRALAAGQLAGVIDVREPVEHSAGAVAEAVNVPVMQIFSGAELPGVEESTADKPVVVYCAHGIRSRQALAIIARQYPGANVKNLLGGYELLLQS